MTLTEKDINKLKKIFKHHYGVDFSFEDIKEKWITLVNLHKELLDPNSNRCYEDY